MIDRTHKLPVSRQARLAGISRGSVYCTPRPINAAELDLMKRMDRLHLEHPFMGARMLRDQLNRKGFAVGRRHVGRLMKCMGIEALYREPGTSKKHPGYTVYPYLLRNLKIERPRQVYALDTTYIPMAKGFVYLTAVEAWFRRKVMAAKVAITLETCHAVEVLQEAFNRHGVPEIVNTDQGSQFTANNFVRAVKNQGSKLRVWKAGEPSVIMSSLSVCGDQ